MFDHPMRAALRSAHAGKIMTARQDVLQTQEGA